MKQRIYNANETRGWRFRHIRTGSRNTSLHPAIFLHFSVWLDIHDHSSG